MAQRDLSRHQEKIVKRYYEQQGNRDAQKLQELVSELWLLAGDPAQKKKSARLWGQAQVALMRRGLDANRVAAVVNAQDVERLAKLVTQSEVQAVAGADPNAGADPGTTREGRGAAPSVADGRTLGDARRKAQAEALGGVDPLSKEGLKEAMRAFRRKLRTLRLDDESRLGGRYTSAGRSSGISAITPPPQFPNEVWTRLTEEGKLRRAGGGMYELIGKL